LKKVRHSGRALVATVAIALGASSTAHAQSAAPEMGAAASEADTALGEIVVTARRREESLISVPVAVTVLGQEALRQANLTQLSDLARVAPAVRVSNVAGRIDALAIAVRGQVDTGGQLTTDPSVGVYFADAIQTRPQGLGRSLYDLASLQVLKGPQGTLFGRNLTGGAVLIVPVAPKLGSVEGYVQGIYGNYNRREVQGALNLPLGERAALRLAGNFTRRDGFTRNLTTGRRLRDDSGDAFRVSLLLEPADGFRNSTVFDYAKGHGHGGGMAPFAVNPAVDTPANRYADRLAALRRQQARSIRVNEDDSDTPQKSSNRGITNTTEIDLGGPTFKNIFNYRRVYSEAYVADGVPQNLILVGNIVKSEQISEEVQILGTTLDGKLDYIVGAYYFFEDGVQTGYVPSLGGPARTNIGAATNVSKSLFAQFDYAITDKLKATVGGRYTWDRRELYQQVRASPTGPNQVEAVVEKTFRKPTWTLSLNYEPTPDTLVYITNRRGYRSGGFNSGATVAAALAPVESEVLTDYELGFKSQGRLGGIGYRTTLAVYRSKYDDIQKNLVAIVGTPPAPARVLLNAAKANINGGEFEATILPTSWLELSGFVGLTDAKYKRFLDPASGADLSNIGFAQVPKWTSGVSGVVTLPVPEQIGVLKLSARYYRQSRVNLADAAPAPGYLQPGYETVSARLSLESIGGKDIRAALFVNNLTNTEYVQSATPFYGAPYGLTAVTYADPRFYGVEVGFRF
jgi:iron complex outermembrane recepter protein